MSRGFIGGILIGAVFSVGVAGVASFMVPIGPAPLPNAPTPSDESDLDIVPQAPETTQLPRSQIVAPSEDLAESTDNVVIVTEPDPVADPMPEPQSEAVPEADEPDVVVLESEAAVAEDVQVETTPDATPDAEPAEIAELEREQTPEPAPAPAPLVALDIDAAAPVTAPDAATPDIALDDPILPNPMALAPMEPTAPDTLAIETQTAPRIEADADIAAPATPTPDTDIATAPSAPDAQPTEAPADVVFGAPDQRTDGRPMIGTPAAITSERDTGVTINRLPTAQSGEQVAPQVQAAGQGPAITRFGQPFANPDDKPLMSVLLMDVGSDLQGGEVGIAALRSFPYPLSFAVDVSLPDAAERMKIYRDEGFEVLAMVDLPQGAQPSDAETTLAVAFSRLPEVIGVLEGLGAGLQPDRATADQVTAILGQGGYGLVTQDKGLNTMPKLAVKEGVPAAPVFRDFDSKGQTSTVIRRFLDQAAFKAGIEGSVIMMGRMRPETISALLVWGLQDRASQVALAPVSAVLKNATPE